MKVKATQRRQTENLGDIVFTQFQAERPVQIVEPSTDRNCPAALVSLQWKAGHDFASAAKDGN
jgi:hypothetical protein